MKTISWKVPVVGVVLIVAVIYVLPTFFSGWWPHKQINLGLDLQGGMHLVLEVKSEKAVESTTERMRNELRTAFREARIRHRGIDVTGLSKLSVDVLDEQDIEKIKSLLKQDFPDLEILSAAGKGAGNYRIDIAFSPEWEDHIKKQAVDQALETIRNRIDQFGVTEPDIRIQGTRRILVQLPGITDTDRAKQLIGKTALLEFKLLDDTGDLASALAGNVPPGSELLYEATDTPEGEDRRPYLVRRETLLTGASLTDARVQIDTQFNEPYVAIDFDRRGARDFERITAENVKKHLAIILDGRVYSAPVIQEKIAGGKARITGNFDMQEARDLAIVLRAGALPAPVEIIEERSVGPALGHDSIRKGIISMTVGGILVLLFMMIYYKGSGMIANLALVFNIILIAAGLSAFGATLTLPGMAGIILTIGMAVDANVIIFERIREELRLGKTPLASIANGFDRASLTILDANVTTLIAALVLFQFGTGPVKGFAVTLSLGVLASLFTALVFCRIIFEHLYTAYKFKTVSI